MGNTAHILGALIMGILVSLQPPINAAMARTLGSSVLAGLVSIAISLVLVLFIWLAWGRGEGDLTQVSALPWWVYIGGIVGAIFVVGSIVSAPVLGVALFFVCVVTGQLLFAAVVDHMGAFGVDVKPINLTKLAGLALVGTVGPHSKSAYSKPGQ